MINLEAEQAVIGCALLEGSWAKEAIISPDHFFDGRNEVIWEAIMKTANSMDKPTDVVSVASELNAMNQLEFVGGISHLTRMMKSVPTTSDFEFYQRLVMEAWKLRAAEDIMRSGAEEIAAAQEQEAITTTIRRLSDIEEAGIKKESSSITDVLIDVVEETEEAMHREEEISGISTKYIDVDRATNGLQSGEVIILAARPSMGKTAFALNIGMNTTDPLANPSFPVGTDIFSLEMEEKDLVKRMICAEGNLDSVHLKNPKRFMRTDENWSKLTMAVSRINDRDIKIHDDPNVSVPEIRAIVRRRVRKAREKNPNHRHVVIIDYLQLIRPTVRSNSRQEEVSEISRALKIMARELKVTVIALSQLSRTVEQRADKRPMLSDLRESGAIEQDADIVAFLYRDDYYNAETEKKNIIELIIGKNRNGPVGTVELVFIKNYNKFVNYERAGRDDVYGENDIDRSHREPSVVSVTGPVDDL